MTHLNQTLPTWDHVIVDGALRVLVDAETGHIGAVQCVKTGLPAFLRFPARSVEHAIGVARNAWQSTADIA